MTSIQSRIVAIAKAYLGKRERAGNLGFVDAAFEREMIRVGWGKGMAWCAFFAELCWTKAYEGDLRILSILHRLFSGSATRTFANFKASPLFVVNRTPAPGALAVWRSGLGWTGHIAVVTDYRPGWEHFHTVEGNTNAAGGREGVEVAVKARRLDFKPRVRGLYLLGFIHPMEANHGAA